MNTGHQETVHIYRTRSVLEELPSTFEGSPIQQNGPDHNGATTATPQVQLSDSMIASPSPSPDEMVIRDRGRRSLPVKWSPIPIASPQKIMDRIPLKRPASKGLIALRSSPRKRLQLTDTSELELGRRALLESSPLLKSPLNLPPPLPKTGSTTETIKGLSQAQLSNILTGILTKHPEIEDEVLQLMPSPDINSMEEELIHCKRVIFKSLPTSRLTSKTDSPAYCKALPHINNLKKILQSHCKQLSDACEWSNLLRYFFLAWSIIKTMPVWDLKSHNNASKKSCFKMLSQNLSMVLKNSLWNNEDELEILIKKLDQCVADYEEVKLCQDYLRQLQNNNAST